MIRNRLVSVAVALCAFAAPLRAQLVQNGGFETGAFIPSWVTSGACAFVGIDGGFPHSGANALFAGPSGATCDVTQTVATTIGLHYTFAFWLMNEEGGGINSFTALWGAQPLLTMNNSIAFGYTLMSFDVTAAASSTNLVFRFRNDPSYWDLDDVSLTAVNTTVPEPSTVALLGAGLLGVSVFRVRRRS